MSNATEMAPAKLATISSLFHVMAKLRSPHLTHTYQHLRAASSRKAMCSPRKSLMLGSEMAKGVETDAIMVLLKLLVRVPSVGMTPHVIIANAASSVGSLLAFCCQLGRCLRLYVFLSFAVVAPSLEKTR